MTNTYNYCVNCRLGFKLTQIKCPFCGSAIKKSALFKIVVAGTLVILAFAVILLLFR